MDDAKAPTGVSRTSPTFTRHPSLKGRKDGDEGNRRASTASMSRHSEHRLSWRSNASVRSTASNHSYADSISSHFDLSALPPCLEPPDATQYSAISRKRSLHDFDVDGTVGQGAYGTVKRMWLKDDSGARGKAYIVKFVIKTRILSDCWKRHRVLGSIPMEIHVMDFLRRTPLSSLPELVDFFEDPDYYFIVMETFGQGLDLFDYIERKADEAAARSRTYPGLEGDAEENDGMELALATGGMSEAEIRAIFKQVAQAVCHLHRYRIIHRDIKDENVILDGKGGAQLIDFGSAAYWRPGKLFNSFSGTIDYAAPEILAGGEYEGPPQDVWALGILCYTLIYKENPFYNIQEILTQELRIPFVMSKSSLDLVRAMLTRDVQARLTLEQVMLHPWLNETEEQSITLTRLALDDLGTSSSEFSPLTPPETPRVEDVQGRCGNDGDQTPR